MGQTVETVTSASILSRQAVSVRHGTSALLLKIMSVTCWGDTGTAEDQPRRRVFPGPSTHLLPSSSAHRCWFVLRFLGMGVGHVWGQVGNRKCAGSQLVLLIQWETSPLPCLLLVLLTSWVVRQRAVGGLTGWGSCAEHLEWGQADDQPGVHPAVCVRLSGPF